MAFLSRLTLAAVLLLAVALAAPAHAVDKDVYLQYFEPGTSVYLNVIPGFPMREVWMNGKNIPTLVVTVINATNESAPVTVINPPQSTAFRRVESDPVILKEAGTAWLLYVSSFDVHAQARTTLANTSLLIGLRSVDCQLALQEFLDHPNSVVYRGIIIERWLHRQNEYAALQVLKGERVRLSDRTAALRRALEVIPTGELNASSLEDVRRAKIAFDAFDETYLNVSRAQQTIARSYPYSFNSGLAFHTCGIDPDFNAARVNASRATSFGGVDSADRFTQSVLGFLTNATIGLASDAPVAEESTSAVALAPEWVEPLVEDVTAPVEVTDEFGLNAANLSVRTALGLLAVILFALAILLYRPGSPHRKRGRTLMDLHGFDDEDDD